METHKPIAHITLNEQDRQRARRVIEARTKPYPGMHKNMVMKEMLTPKFIATTLMAEMAFCRLYGIQPNLVTKGYLPHYDCVMDDKRIIDVKFSYHEHANLLVPMNLFIKGHTDLFALLTSTDGLTFNMWGFATFFDVCQPQFYRTAKFRQPCILYPAKALRKNVYPLRNA